MAPCVATTSSTLAGGLGALRQSRSGSCRVSAVRRTTTVAQARRSELEQATRTAVAAAQTTVATAVLTAAPSAAWAEEAVQAVRAPSLNPFSAVSTTEAIVLSAPVILYAGFSAARTANPALKFGDFMFGLVALAVFGNIFAILALKIRLF